MLNHIHHINFLVKDLNLAVERYQEILGLQEFRFDELAGRAVRTARIKLGDCWLVLVEPQDQTSVPARHLAEHGEGFFLISFGTDDLLTALDRIAQNGGQLDSGGVRTGLDNWQVADLQMAQFFGAQIQLTQDDGEN